MLTMTQPKLKTSFGRTDYLSKMKGWADLIGLNLAWLGWSMACWKEVLDWSVTLAGAVTLLAINILRLKKALRKHRKVDKSD